MLNLLTGIRVIDLSRLLPGGLATSKLADLGADVIKVESPPAGDYLRDLPPFVNGMGLSFRMINKNKRSIGLDLTSNEGRGVFLDLLATSDVVVEGSRPGTMKKRNLDFDTLRTVNDRLVYCSVSGYGQTGPFRGLASHGLNIDAAAGLIRVKRAPGERPEIILGSAQGVHSAGTHAALAIVSALVQRGRTGRGEYLDASCWDAAICENHALEIMLQEPGAVDTGSSADELLTSVMINPSLAGGLGPRYNVYGTADDKVLLICPIERRFWEAFCNVAQRPEWRSRGSWAGEMDFGEDDPALRDEIEALMRTRSSDEWIEALMSVGVPVSPVLSADELACHPSLKARAMVAHEKDGESLAYIRPPVSVPGDDFAVLRPPPTLGNNTIEVLNELGYSSTKQRRLLDSGVALGR